jgi:SAM-dependent methyltransferase
MSTTERANSGLHSHILDKIGALEIPSNSKILDLGCGSGIMLRRLRQLGYSDLHGFDIAPPKNVDKKIGFLAGDLDCFVTPFADNTVDLVTAVEVIEHVENVGTLLTEIFRILKPTGVFLVTTPNVVSVEARFRFLILGQLKQFDVIGDPTHVYPVFPYPFAKVLRRHCLLVSESWGFPLDGSSPTSRYILRLAVKLLHVVGIRGEPSGDNLCMVIRPVPGALEISRHLKREMLTEHY